MKCKKCKSEMFIDEWDGWVWRCPCCDFTGRKSTPDEIKKNEEINNNEE